MTSHEGAIPYDGTAALAAARERTPLMRVAGSEGWLVLRRADVERLAWDPRLTPHRVESTHPGAPVSRPSGPFDPSFLERVRVTTGGAARRLVALALEREQLDVGRFADALVAGLERDERTRSGHRATRDLVVTAILVLAGSPPDLAALRADPLLVPRAVEEVARSRPVVSILARVALAEVEIAPFTIRPGEGVRLSIASANRDQPGTEPDPETFAVRRPATPHLSFGVPPGTCPGAAVARLITQEALRALLERCDCWWLPGGPRAGPGTTTVVLVPARDRSPKAVALP